MKSTSLRLKTPDNHLGMLRDMRERQQHMLIVLGMVTNMLSISRKYNEYHRITESQNGRGWKGPLWVTESQNSRGWKGPLWVI